MQTILNQKREKIHYNLNSVFISKLIRMSCWYLGALMRLVLKKNLRDFNATVFLCPEHNVVEDATTDNKQ